MRFVNQKLLHWNIKSTYLVRITMNPWDSCGIPPPNTRVVVQTKTIGGPAEKSFYTLSLWFPVCLKFGYFVYNLQISHMYFCIVCNCQRWKMSTQPVFAGWWEMFLKSPRHGKQHLVLLNQRWNDDAYRNHPDSTPTRTMETDAPVMDVNCWRKRQLETNLKGWTWAKGQQSKYRSSGSWNSQVGQ